MGITFITLIHVSGCPGDPCRSSIAGNLYVAYALLKYCGGR